MSSPVLPNLHDQFVFTRGRVADYRAANGAIVSAAVDEPRFDHDVKGKLLGLLVEGRPDTRHPDRLASKPGAWAQGKATVLHEFITPGGKLRRRACYIAANHRETVDGFVNTKGWHRQIAVVAGYLKNEGGAVRWRRVDWTLGAILAVDDGIALGVTPEILLLEG
ncbi:hypothetical protein [Brevundimonas sp.]|uniref:hypothetical protein n=1 Tax=Brevundimonas sp. TaxID=1871086 RepID=UPI003F6F5686